MREMLTVPADDHQAHVVIDRHGISVDRIADSRVHLW